MFLAVSSRQPPHVPGKLEKQVLNRQVRKKKRQATLGQCPHRGKKKVKCLQIVKASKSCASKTGITTTLQQTTKQQMSLSGYQLAITSEEYNGFPELAYTMKAS